MSTTADVKIAGYLAGTWTIDTTHSEVGFVARHLMVSKVRGKFESFEGSFSTGSDPLQSSTEVTVDLSSINTGNEQRDGHLRSSDFFDVEAHSTMTFKSTGVRVDGDRYLLDGDLTIHGVTKPITFNLELNGFGADPWGGTRAGFSATGEINRSDFGITWNAAIEGGGVVVSDRIQIALEVEGVLKTD
jgi:polyisoprenoid-binding protein YceI